MIRTVDYIIGLSGEIISETQRKEFRDDPKNTGKLYTVGLFYFARYVNYGSNLIWRGCVCCCTWMVGLWVVVSGDVCQAVFDNVVSVMDRYCAKRVSFPPMMVNGANGDSRGLSGLSIRRGCRIS